MGIYNKTGAEDLILTTLDAPEDARQLSWAWTSQVFPRLLLTTFISKSREKAIAFVFSGADLVKAVFEAANATPTPAITPHW